MGRAGHQVGARSVAKIFPKFRGDLLEATVVADRMIAGAVEPTKIPKNPLDVLAQQIVAAVAMDQWTVDEMFDMVRRAGPYRDLARGPFEAVLDMLAGRYPSEMFGELRPRLVWDRVDHTLTARTGAHRLAVTNPGTIPDRGLYTVNLPDGGRVGRTRRGDGLRVPTRRRLHPRHLGVADHRHHRRPSRGGAGAG